MNRIENLIIGTLIALVFYCISMAVISIYKGSMCFENGYPEYYVSLNLDTYCIRTIEQTQYVVPLDEVLKESK